MVYVHAFQNFIMPMSLSPPCCSIQNTYHVALRSLTYSAVVYNVKKEGPSNLGGLAKVLKIVTK